MSKAKEHIKLNKCPACGNVRTHSLLTIYDDKITVDCFRCGITTAERQREDKQS